MCGWCLDHSSSRLAARTGKRTFSGHHCRADGHLGGQLLRGCWRSAGFNFLDEAPVLGAHGVQQASGRVSWAGCCQASDHIVQVFALCLHIQALS